MSRFLGLTSERYRYHRMTESREIRVLALSGQAFAAGRVIGLYFAWEHAYLYVLGSLFT